MPKDDKVDQLGTRVATAVTELMAEIIKLAAKAEAKKRAAKKKAAKKKVAKKKAAKKKVA